MPVQGSNTQAKEPLGSTILKILVVSIVAIIGVMLLFGVIFPGFDPISLLLTGISILLLLAILSLAIKGIISFFDPKPFSPTESFRDTNIRLSKKAKPFNVRDLYLRGEDMRTCAKWGKIEGVGFLPYITSRIQRNEKGKPICEVELVSKGLDESGTEIFEKKVIYEKEWNKYEQNFLEVPKYKYETITEQDGDILFIVKKEKSAFLSLFNRRVDIVRCHKKYCSDILGDVFIKDVNLVPYGEYLYPAKQWQNDIIKIMKENEAQAIVTTHRNNLDLVSNVTQMSLGADPTFQKIMLAQSERLSSGYNNVGGGQ